MRIILLLFLIVFVASCDYKLSEKQKKAISKEKAAREIKKLSNATINEHAFQLGDSLCNMLHAQPSTEYLAGLRATHALKTIQQETGLDSADAAILDMVQYNLENNLEMVPSIIEKEQVFIFYCPIKNDSTLSISILELSKKAIIDQL